MPEPTPPAACSRSRAHGFDVESAQAAEVVLRVGNFAPALFFEHGRIIVDLLDLPHRFHLFQRRGVQHRRLQRSVAQLEAHDVLSGHHRIERGIDRGAIAAGRCLKVSGQQADQDDRQSVNQRADDVKPPLVAQPGAQAVPENLGQKIRVVFRAENRRRHDGLTRHDCCRQRRQGKPGCPPAASRPAPAHPAPPARIADHHKRRFHHCAQGRSRAPRSPLVPAARGRARGRTLRRRLRWANRCSSSSANSVGGRSAGDGISTDDSSAGGGCGSPSGYNSSIWPPLKSLA